KEISSTELTKIFLDRIENVNDKINAVVKVNKNALKEAKRIDENYEKYKDKALYGLGITIKDSIDTVGIVTTGGTKGRENYVPREDASVVKRLKEEGAIILGKTNTPELTLEYETNNKIYGKTNNPYDLNKSPGGSSGGAAAAVATGCSAFDIGSDTAGSIRLPAHFCGICGIRGTKGRVASTGSIIPNGIGITNNLTQLGPLTRYVEDLDLVMQVISAPDGKDPNVIPMDWKNYNSVKKDKLKGIYYLDNGIYKVDDNIKKGVLKTVDFLKSQGIKIEKAQPPALDKTFSLFKRIFSADGWNWKYSLLKKYNTIDEVKENSKKALNGIEFNKLLGEWQEFREKNLKFMKDYDFIISPVTAFAAQEHGFSYNKEVIAAFSYTMIYNLLGWPALTMPISKTKKGLAIGVQIASLPWREDISLSLAKILEKENGGFKKPPLV
ncbi:MAG: amidase, partial [Bacillota bacterium]